MGLSHVSGFESILCYDDGIDVAELTRHVERWEQDLRLVKQTGLSTFRYPWRWPSIEREEGRYDWGFTDDAMALMRDLETAERVRGLACLMPGWEWRDEYEAGGMTVAS